jgi:hypothetical protein
MNQLARVISQTAGGKKGCDHTDLSPQDHTDLTPIASLLQLPVHDLDTCLKEVGSPSDWMTSPANPLAKSA